MVGASNGVALVLANIEAIRARHISTEYGETKYVGMAMGSILQVTLIGASVMFLVKDNPSATYLIRTSMVFVATMSILTLIFVPKIYIWSQQSNASMKQPRVDHNAGNSSSGPSRQPTGEAGYNSDMVLSCVRWAYVPSSLESNSCALCFNSHSS